ncbi:DUF4157 domain-containing protein [Brachybacterium vulturis]|uniref:eCIS core domain-containing protein n=1 Tax=Brachybacterium vulturis TaxID=2017484 RepID=UPI0037351F35
MAEKAQVTKRSRSSVGNRHDSFFPAAQRAGTGSVARKRAGRAGPVQGGLTVSAPSDPLEKQAEHTADTVLRMPVGPVHRSASGTEEIQRDAAAEEVQPSAAREEAQRTTEEEPVQRSPSAAVTALRDRHGPVSPAELRAAATGGQPLPAAERTFLEPRLGVPLATIRLHTDEQAGRLSRRLGAKAFTYRGHVFFAPGQFRPGTPEGRHLLAHELTHTIQQGATSPGATAAPGTTAAPRTTNAPRPTGAPVTGAGPAAGTGTTAAPGATGPLRSGPRTAGPSAAAHIARQVGPTTPDVQRLGMDDVLEYIADKVGDIPGYRMLTLALETDPITGEDVERSGANLLRALVELVPFGTEITQTLDAHGVFESAAGWIEEQLGSLLDLGERLVAALDRFLDSLGLSDILDLGDVWDRGKDLVLGAADAVIDVCVDVAVGIFELVKAVILPPVAAWAAQTRGYPLLTALLGYDPITDEEVDPTPEALIGGFMTLIGQAEIWENLRAANAVERAWAWFQTARAELLPLVASVPERILAALSAWEWTDLLSVLDAAGTVITTFVGIAEDFVAWGLRQVLGLLTILVDVVAPRLMPYIARARSTFGIIVRDPVGFVRNLVAAARLGFQNFADNILIHLRTALISWLVGPLAAADVYIPTSFSLVEILKMLLSILGITWQKIRGKLLRVIPEPVLVGLERTAAVLVTLVQEGPAAAWEQIQGELTALKDHLITSILDMVATQVVQAAVARLVMMLNPAGAVLQAIVAIWRTISFFVEKIQQIAAVVGSFVDSITAIAAGRIVGAAQSVEQTMVRTLSLVISFLANFAGLGGIPEKLVAIVERLRAPVDRALDKIVDWLERTLKKATDKAKSAARSVLQWWRKRIPLRAGDEQHTLGFEGGAQRAELVVRSVPLPPHEFLAQQAKEAEVEKEDADPKVAAVRADVEEAQPLQQQLRAFDEDVAAAASGDELATAEDTASRLDGLLHGIAGKIVDALTSWGAAGGERLEFLELRGGGLKIIKELRISRGSFSDAQKRGIATHVKENISEGAEHLRDAKREGMTAEQLANLNVARGIARRHVVSAGDMRSHYLTFLHDKTLVRAKVLLEERGSIGASHTPVKTPLTQETVRDAAKKRYRAFFGFAANIFLGDSRENSSIQENLDGGHPDLAGQKLWDHVARIKRGWALDQGFTPSERNKGEEI